MSESKITELGQLLETSLTEMYGLEGSDPATSSLGEALGLFTQIENDLRRLVKSHESGSEIARRMLFESDIPISDQVRRFLETMSWRPGKEELELAWAASVVAAIRELEAKAKIVDDIRGYR